MRRIAPPRGKKNPFCLVSLKFPTERDLRREGPRVTGMRPALTVVFGCETGDSGDQCGQALIGVSVCQGILDASPAHLRNLDRCHSAWGPFSFLHQFQNQLGSGTFC